MRVLQLFLLCVTFGVNVVKFFLANSSLCFPV